MAATERYNISCTGGTPTTTAYVRAEYVSNPASYPVCREAYEPGSGIFMQDALVSGPYASQVAAEAVCPFREYGAVGAGQSVYYPDQPDYYSYACVGMIPDPGYPANIEIVCTFGPGANPGSCWDGCTP
jgi:hypothetical protein